MFLTNCFSQNDFINYVTQDGLSSNQVYDIYQDQQGVIWFATDRGLSSFNGSFFTNFSTLDGLLSDVVLDFFPQKDGTVWCSTEKGKLFIFDPTKRTFTAFKYNHLLPESDIREVKSILLDDGNFYFRFKGMTGYLKITSLGTATEQELDRTIFLVNEYYVHRITNDFYYYSKSNINAINSVPLSGSNRDFIVANGDYVARIDFTYFEILHQEGDLQKIELIESGELLQIGSAKDFFWVTGYNIGTKIINTKGEIIRTYLPELPCSRYFEDVDDGIWISTLSNGVYYAPATNIKVLEIAKNEHITSLSSDSNKLAFGTHSGSVFEYLLRNKDFEERKSSNRGIVQYYKNELYSNITDQQSEVLSSFIRRISDNPNRPLLLTTSKSIWDTDDRSILVGRAEVYDAEWFADNLIVSQGTCIKVFDLSSNLLDSIDLQTITLDIDVADGRIYCATSSKGLIFLDKNLNVLKSINADFGLKSNFVNEVILRKGEIWLATRNGVTRITNLGSENEKVSTIGVSNGLIDNEVNDLDFIGDTLFLGTRSGVNYFDISKWEEIINSNASIFFSIKEISQQGKELFSTENLAHDENDLTVELELAFYNWNNNILFRYMLDGLDKDWTVTRSRMLNFKSLPPGQYQLLIQANVNDNWYEEVLSQKIIIHPAWYTTWWFTLSAVLFVVFIIWLFFKYRILNYNREIIKEILRHLLKRVKGKSKLFIVRSNGKDIRLDSEQVLYVESSRNYLTIYCENQKVIVREKISDFLKMVPDPIEYVQVRRSVIVRIDKVTGKSKDSISIKEIEINVGVTYKESIKQIHL